MMRIKLILSIDNYYFTWITFPFISKQEREEREKIYLHNLWKAVEARQGTMRCEQ